jgi:hypothetical protein
MHVVEERLANFTGLGAIGECLNERRRLRG